MPRFIHPGESVLIRHESIVIHLSTQTFGRSITDYQDLLRPVCTISTTAAVANQDADGTLLAA
jgi:hypothetical protein